MKNIMKVGKDFKEFGLLIKFVSKTIKNEAQEQKGEFLVMLLSILAKIVLWNMLAGKPKLPGQGEIKADKWTIREGVETNITCQDF